MTRSCCTYSRFKIRGSGFSLYGSTKYLIWSYDQVWYITTPYLKHVNQKNVFCIFCCPYFSRLNRVKGGSGVQVVVESKCQHDLGLHKIELTWWRHQMAICAGNSPVPGEFPSQRPVTRSFDVFFDLRLNIRLSKQSWGWWFETLSSPLWRHSNELALNHNRNK